MKSCMRCLILNTSLWRQRIGATIFEHGRIMKSRKVMLLSHFIEYPADDIDSAKLWLSRHPRPSGDITYVKDTMLLLFGMKMRDKTKLGETIYKIIEAQKSKFNLESPKEIKEFVERIMEMPEQLGVIG